MALSQMLYSMENKKVLETASLNSEKELEDLLCENIDLLDPNWLVIGRQIITQNGKVLDLLCMDRGYQLIVVELKKDLTPREVTAQVIEYASYVSEMGQDKISSIYQSYAEKYLNSSLDLNKAFRNRFGIELDESQIGMIPKMVIVASGMDDGTEHIIRYLRQTYTVDINILFFQIFRHGDERILSRAWFEKDIEVNTETKFSPRWNREYYVSFGFGEENARRWDDACKYGFISAGGGKWYTQTLKMLHEGDRIWVNIPHVGYVGVGIVQADVQQASEAGWEVDGTYTPMKEMQLKGCYFYHEEDSDLAEFVVPVKWIRTFPIKDAVKELGFFGNQNTVCRPVTEKWNFTVGRLKQLWHIEDSCHE